MEKLQKLTVSFWGDYVSCSIVSHNIFHTLRCGILRLAKLYILYILECNAITSGIE